MALGFRVWGLHVAPAKKARNPRACNTLNLLEVVCFLFLFRALSGSRFRVWGFG